MRSQKPIITTKHLGVGIILASITVVVVGIMVVVSIVVVVGIMVVVVAKKYEKDDNL